MTRPSLAALERFPPPRSWYKFSKKTNYQAKHFRPVLRRGWNVDFCSSLRHSGLLNIYTKLSLSPCFTREGIKCIPMPSQVSPIWKLYKIENWAGAYAVLAYFVLCPEYPRGNQRHFESQSFLAADDVGEEIPSQKQRPNVETKKNKAFGFILRLRYFLWGKYISRWQPNYLGNFIIISIIIYLSTIYLSSIYHLQWSLNLNLSLHDRMLFCSIIFFACFK